MGPYGLTMGKEIVVYDPRKFERDQAKVGGNLWPKLKRVARRIPFLADLLSAYFCAIDPETPRPVKAVLMGALAYFILPVDIVPDFIAIFGFTDDATVLYAAIRTVLPHIKPRHKEMAKAKLDQLLAG